MKNTQKLAGQIVGQTRPWELWQAFYFRYSANGDDKAVLSLLGNDFTVHKQSTKHIVPCQHPTQSSRGINCWWERKLTCLASAHRHQFCEGQLIRHIKTHTVFVLWFRPRSLMFYKTPCVVIISHGFRDIHVHHQVTSLITAYTHFFMDGADAHIWNKALEFYPLSQKTICWSWQNRWGSLNRFPKTPFLIALGSQLFAIPDPHGDC